MRYKKEYNQYYAQFFEEAICALINKQEPTNNTDFLFSDEEINEMISDAKIATTYLKGDKAICVGRKTLKASCDILIDGKELEIKYVGFGNGTYYNTTIQYIDKELGLKSYHELLTKKGYLVALQKEFGDIVRLDNISPVSIADSKYIRKNFEKKYNQLVAVEKTIRAEYVNYVYHELQKNKKLKVKFINDMITKETSKKHIPDSILVFNHDTKKISISSKEDIESLVKETEISISGKLSISFGGVRVAFGWQNGNGLSNPTLRIFI